MKMNKKGFTLIELLAVIIILGVLMVIAIPSVTAYISSSRKSAYADTAISYIKAVQTKVNQGGEWVGYDTETLYLVPVSNKTDNSCVALESGGASPFSDTWKYAYVGYTANAQGFKYYFMALDGSGNGINFIPFDGLQNLGGDTVYAGNQYISDFSSDDGFVVQSCVYEGEGTLCSTYNPKFANNHATYVVDDNGKSSMSTEKGKPDMNVFKDVVEDAEDGTGKEIKNIKVLTVSECNA